MSPAGPVGLAPGPILLIGVGDLGTRVGLRLVDAGRQVIGLRRSLADVPAQFDVLSGDITDPDSLQRAVGHLAGDGLNVVFTVTAGERTEEAYQRVYVDGMASVVETLRPGKIVVVSSTAVYDVHDGSWVDESTVAAPTAFSGCAMREMERIAEAQVAQATTVRLSGIYGPGRTRFVDQVRNAKATFGPEPSYTNRIHVDDAAALVALAAQAESAPAAVIGVDHEPAPRREVIEWMAERLGVAMPGVDADFRPVTNKRCRSDVAASLGFEPAYPTFREGYESLLS